jgi:hypothetical protein
VALADGPDGTRVATVQAVRRDGVILEFFLRIHQEGVLWKIDR